MAITVTSRGQSRSVVRLVRRRERFEHIGLFDQWRLWVAGRNDAKAGFPFVDSTAKASGAPLPAAPLRETPLSPDLSTAFLGRLVEAFTEVDGREYLVGESSVVAETQRLNDLLRQRDVEELKTVELLADRDRLATLPRITIDELILGPAEEGDADAVVVARRQRPRDRQLADQQKKLDAAKAHAEALQIAIAGVATGILVVFDATVTRSHRNRAHFERRAAIYRRALTRYHHAGPTLQRLLGESTTIPTAAWTQQPCRWVPEELIGFPLSAEQKGGQSV